MMAANVSLPVLPGASAGVGLGGGVDEGDLGWMWKTVGATCCWAMSDVICDLCIKPGMDSETKSDGEEVEFDFLVDENSPPASLRRLQPIDMSSAAGAAEVTSSTMAAKLARAPANGGPRQRKRQQKMLMKALARPSGPATSPRSSVRSPVGVVPPLSLEPTTFDTRARQLTPEQNALLSGCISLCAAAIVGLGQHSPGVSRTAGLASLFRVDVPSALAAVGGCFHFSAYLATLCAFSSASSTVITPLMQLSAMWMLPFSMTAALFGFASLIRPVHLLSIALICTGGFLPAASGQLSYVLSSSFWKQSAVRYVVLGELLICCYNVILHQATFFSGIGQQAVSLNDEPDSIGSPLRFFLISRAANGLSCLCLFCSVPSLRQHALAMRSVGIGFLATSFVGECLSTFGVCLVTFSYSSFYEPSVVNAVEGGLQQLFNLLFALATHRILGWGRGVDQVPVKIVSFLLVASGLCLSTV